MTQSAPTRSIRAPRFGANLALVLMAVLLGCVACDTEKRIPDGAVVIDIYISPSEAETGVTKLVKAPDYETYDMIIRPGIKTGDLLKLPPKIAERYPYPLIFRVNVVTTGGADSPADK